LVYTPGGRTRDPQVKYILFSDSMNSSGKEKIPRGSPPTV